MTAHEPEPSPADVRQMMAELRDLVGDLGLGEDLPPQSPVPRERAPVTAFLKEGAAGMGAVAQADAATGRAYDDDDDDDDEEFEDSDAVPLWEAEVAEVAELVNAMTLWDAFAPELETAPSRPWTPAAAMAAVQPAAPPRPPAVQRQPLLRRWSVPFRNRLFTAITGLAAVAAIAVLLVTRLDLGHTAGPSQAVSGAPFQVTTLRTVSATTPREVASAPAKISFSSDVPAIYLDIVYRNVTASDTLRLRITLQPVGTAVTTSQLVSDVTHSNLDPGGEIAVTIQAPAGGFLPGTYTVTAMHGAHLEQDIQFVVQGSATFSPGASTTGTAFASPGATATASPAASTTP
ncbi:MAG TPA: hypothetical protein VGQ42_00805 [Candidatus Dormibacteraeota bacterium]|jgi:hypothetical protein|nr:hypothetical protein [Candidatus Dormibacteraeota bacterium]